MISIFLLDSFKFVRAIRKCYLTTTILALHVPYERIYWKYLRERNENITYRMKKLCIFWSKISIWK